MAGGYQVGIASETKAFKQGIDSGIIEPLEDAQKELLELGRNRGPEQLEKAMKDAQRETKDLKEETERTARAIEQEYRDSYRKMRQSSDDAYDKAKEGADEFKDEANSTAREAAASFDGSAESIADMFQEVAANAFAGFGPAGAVAGLAAAAGIGLAIGGFQDVQKAQEETNELAAEWAQRYIESGSLVMSVGQQIAAFQKIIGDPEEYQKSIDNARNWGVEHETAVSAMTGDLGALDEVRTALTDREREALGIRNQLADGSRTATEEEAKLLGEVERGIPAFEQLTEAQERASAAAGLNDRMLANLADTTVGATRKVDEFGDAVYTLPDGTTIYIDAETGQATANTEALEDKIYGIKDKTVRVNVTADTSSAERSLARIINKGREIRIGTRIVGPAGTRWD